MPAKTNKKYNIIVERDEDGYFVASVPSVPGCYAQAKTLPDLHIKIRDAISLCLEVARSNKKYRERIKALAYDPTFIGFDTVTL